jgi:hypothetical protein
MPAFTYLWTRDEYERHRRRGGHEFLCAGGNTFRDRGVRAGDDLYIVSFFGGQLYLLGRLAVGAVCGPEDAPRLTGRDGFDYSWARDWAVGDASRSSHKHFDLVVPPEAVRAIRFKGGRPPAYRGEDEDAEPDPQTFRGVRALSWETAEGFDRLLAEHERSP